MSEPEPIDALEQWRKFEELIDRHVLPYEKAWGVPDLPHNEVPKAILERLADDCLEIVRDARERGEPVLIPVKEETGQWLEPKWISVPENLQMALDRADDFVIRSSCRVKRYPEHAPFLRIQPEFVFSYPPHLPRHDEGRGAVIFENYIPRFWKQVPWDFESDYSRDAVSFLVHLAIVTKGYSLFRLEDALREKERIDSPMPSESGRFEIAWIKTLLDRINTNALIVDLRYEKGSPYPLPAREVEEGTYIPPTRSEREAREAAGSRPVGPWGNLPEPGRYDHHLTVTLYGAPNEDNLAGIEDVVHVKFLTRKLAKILGGVSIIGARNQDLIEVGYDPERGYYFDPFEHNRWEYAPISTRPRSERIDRPFEAWEITNDDTGAVTIFADYESRKALDAYLETLDYPHSVHKIPACAHEAVEINIEDDSTPKEGHDKTYLPWGLQVRQFLGSGVICQDTGGVKNLAIPEIV